MKIRFNKINLSLQYLVSFQYIQGFPISFRIMRAECREIFHRLFSHIEICGGQSCEQTNSSEKSRKKCRHWLEVFKRKSHRRLARGHCQSAVKLIWFKSTRLLTDTYLWLFTQVSIIISPITSSPPAVFPLFVTRLTVSLFDFSNRKSGQPPLFVFRTNQAWQSITYLFLIKMFLSVLYFKNAKNAKRQLWCIFHDVHWESGGVIFDKLIRLECWRFTVSVFFLEHSDRVVSWLRTCPPHSSALSLSHQPTAFDIVFS